MVLLKIITLKSQSVNFFGIINRAFLLNFKILIINNKSNNLKKLIHIRILY